MKNIYSNDQLKSYSNEKRVVIFKKIQEKAMYPTRATKFSSGIDLYAFYDVIILPGKCMLIDVGLSVFIPDGYELQIRPRSSLSLKGLFTMFGTIDSDYVGMSLGVIVFNSLKEDFKINAGTRLAQAVIASINNSIVLDSELSLICESSEERKGGFGSTGI